MPDLGENMIDSERAALDAQSHLGGIEMPI